MDQPLRLRAGRSVGRTLYQLDSDGEDKLIGMVDTPALAGTIVTAVNGIPDVPDHGWLQQQLADYIAMLQAQQQRGRLSAATVESYTNGAEQLVRWIQGTFHPGEGQ